MQIYFFDPQSPWQRGTNENTNGLLRQYFPTRTSLAGFTRRELTAIDRELNERPRKTLNWVSPLEALNELVASPFEPARAVIQGAHLLDLPGFHRIDLITLHEGR